MPSALRPVGTSTVIANDASSGASLAIVQGQQFNGIIILATRWQQHTEYPTKACQYLVHGQKLILINMQR
jgi:hypothetical protein